MLTDNDVRELLRLIKRQQLECQLSNNWDRLMFYTDLYNKVDNLEVDFGK